MADTVLNTTVFDGDKKLITHYNVVSDASGGTTTIVDVSELASNNEIWFKSKYNFVSLFNPIFIVDGNFANSS